MIELTNITKEFKKGKRSTRALSDINISIPYGSWHTITGKSGSGKSTLLYTIAGLVKPDTGRVHINGNSVYDLSPSKRANIRGKNIGFVFQSFYLIPHLTVLENLLVSGGIFSKDTTRASALLDRLGLSERASHMPSELSVGEKQRTAVARAVFCKPSIILADEPTGNLDSENSDKVMSYLKEFNQEGITVVLVTHMPKENFEVFSNECLEIADGRLL
ncbi:MAG: ABC transporter ATP-binding protein [Fibrobacteria bacterium]|nr:ABC transporter ATP-binding protein [Fibrobacteria bacterium]